MSGVEKDDGGTGSFDSGMNCSLIAVDGDVVVDDVIVDEDSFVDCGCDDCDNEGGVDAVLLDGDSFSDSISCGPAWN